MSAPRPLPRDAALPQLPIALDETAMREHFAAALRGGGMLVGDCRIERAKYRPGRNCTVGYRLAVADERSGECFEQIVAGRFCARGEAERRHGRDRLQVGRASRCGIGSLLLRDLELFAWLLPNDPKLAGLPLLLALIERGGPALSEAAGAWSASGRAGAGALVQYVAELRACARFEVSAGDRPGGMLYAKLDAADTGFATLQVLQTLQRETAGGSALRVPRPLLWQPRTGLLWQTGLPGTPLLDCPPARQQALAPQIGLALAALHRSRAPIARRVGVDQTLACARDCVALLDRALPEAADPARALLRRLAADAHQLRGLPLATLHGDLHPRNLLCDGNTVCVVDLDGMRLAPAAMDLGAWIADGLFRALLAGEPLTPALQRAQAMLAGYRSDSSAPIPEGALAWACASALLCERAYRGVTNLKPGRLEVLPDMLRVALRIAEAGQLEAAAEAA